MAAVEKRRITQIGNSLGITLPSSMLDKLNITKGDEVHVEIESGKLIIKKKPVMVELPEGMPADFFELLKEEMEAHKETMKGLVNR